MHRRRLRELIPYRPDAILERAPEQHPDGQQQDDADVGERDESQAKARRGGARIVSHGAARNVARYRAA